MILNYYYILPHNPSDLRHVKCNIYLQLLCGRHIRWLIIGTVVYLNQWVSYIIELLQVVALVCNFSGSNFQSVRLHHSDVETLFHEFGHALHSLLSRTVSMVELYGILLIGMIIISKGGFSPRITNIFQGPGWRLILLKRLQISSSE